VIYMRVKVPSSLQGGSLLDAHKWVKSQMARRNPGGTADYTLADSMGNPMTLSDLVRSNPNEVEIDIIGGRGAVRSNPSLPLPADFVPSPDFPRGGNFSTQLLPRDLDPALVERMVAQEGVFGAVNTLTILLTQRSADEGISPTTAGLLYAHSAIPRTNPSGKTPFLADVAKDMYDSEIMIHRYLDRHGITDVTQQETAIGKAKVSAKYDLTQRTLEQFVKEVLAPFLAVASANRGALRTINKISAGMDSNEKKDFANNYGKLMYLMPTKAEDFMKGREYGLVASSEFIYPVFAMKLLSDKEINTLLEVAKKFPNNLEASGKGIKLTSQQAKLIANRVNVSDPFWKRMLMKIPFIGGPVQAMGITGDAAEAKATLIKGKVPPREKMIAYIVESVNIDNYRYGTSKQDSKFLFMRDIGGFYPSPPKRWPLEICYAVMDAFLEALPDLVDIRDPAKNYESKISFELLSKLRDDTVLSHSDPKIKDMTYGDYKKAMAGKDADRESLLTSLGVNGTVAGGAKTQDKFTNYVFTEFTSVGLTAFEVNRDLGKSVLELLYEVMEIATSKYHYELSDDDITFTLTLIDYSIRTLFDDGASIAAPTALMTSIFGRKKSEQVTEAYERLVAGLGTGAMTSGTPSARAAVIHLSMVQALMDKIESDGGMIKADKLTQIASIKATYPPGGLPAWLGILGNDIIDATEKRIIASP
jgi:hypothetical protein